MRLIEVTEDPFKEEIPPDRVEDYFDRMRRSGTALSTNPNHVAAANSIIKQVGKDKTEFAEARRALIKRLEKAKNKKRNPEYERMIKVFPKDAFEYVKRVLDYERWPEAEPYIMRDPTTAVDYAALIIQGRWPEAEMYIKKNPVAAATYAAWCIKGPWPEAEDIIVTSPHAVAKYAERVLQQPWRRGEHMLLKEGNYYSFAIQYTANVRKSRWPELEQAILNEDDDWKVSTAVGAYASQVIKGRWPEGEQRMLKFAQGTSYSGPRHLVDYVEDVIKPASGLNQAFSPQYRWPEAEPFLVKNKEQRERYARLVFGGNLKSSEYRQFKKEAAARAGITIK